MIAGAGAGAAFELVRVPFHMLLRRLGSTSSAVSTANTASIAGVPLRQHLTHVARAMPLSAATFLAYEVSLQLLAGLAEDEAANDPNRRLPPSPQPP